MANNHGTAILHFDPSARAAVYKTEEVTTDATPNPMNWPVRNITKGGFYTNHMIRHIVNNRWIITTANNITYISNSDGLYWTQGNNVAGNDNWKVGVGSHGVGIIVGGASGFGSTYVLTEANGGNPTAAGNLPQVANWVAPVYNGSGRWLTIQTGVSGNVAAYSDNNGSTWTAISTMPVKTYSGIVWDGTYYITVASTDSHRSADGVTTWTSVGAFGVSGGWTGLCSNGSGLTIVFRTNNNAVWYTTNNATSWTEVLLPWTITSLSCRYVNGYFIALLSDTTGTFLRSSDGINWEKFNTIQTGGNSLVNFDYNPNTGAALVIESTTGSGNPFKMWTSTGGIPYSGLPGRTIDSINTLVEPAMNNVGSNYASVTITGQTELLATDNIDAWIQGTDSTADHNAVEHKIAPIKLSVTNIVPGVGFDIIGLSEYRLDGDFKVRWAWAT